MPKQEQSPEILFKRITAIEVEWIKDNFLSENGMTLFYTDNPDMQIFVGGNYFQVYMFNKWHSFFENIDYKNKKTHFKK